MPPVAKKLDGLIYVKKDRHKTYPFYVLFLFSFAFRSIKAHVNKGLRFFPYIY